MEVIDWNRYDPKTFELFCSALLTFEFGKSYKPFSASGPDGGIDGSYTGSYNNKDGDWRFQFKFHSMARSQAVSVLKREISSEAGKIKKENFFVLMTNVELRPSEHDQMAAIFNEHTHGEGKHVECIIWDGAKLYNFFLQHPLLSLWLNEGFETAQLQRFDLHFKSSLETSDYYPGGFGNQYIARETSFIALEQFLKSDSPVFVISGEAGIGKTRLVIEFFKYVDTLKNWTPLVLVSHQVNFDKIRKALSSNSERYVILLDDAQYFDPKVISDMKTIADGSKKMVKIILTARLLDVYKSLSLIKEYESAKFPTISLEQLSRQDTETLLRAGIDLPFYLNYIAELVTISHGKPIMIMAILNAIKKGQTIGEIRSSNFFKNYVSNYFESFISELKSSIHLSSLSLRRLLRSIAFIEPFDYSGGSVIEKLSAIHEIRRDDLQYILSELKIKGFVRGRYEQSIKPDYYSDVLISEMNTEEAESLIAAFPESINNIIINLSSVDEISLHDRNFLKRILDSYANSIIADSGRLTSRQVINAARELAIIRPDFSRQVIINYLKLLKATDSIAGKILKEDTRTDLVSDSHLSGIIISTLRYLYGNIANIEFCLDRSIDLYSIAQNNKIASVFSFSKRDVDQGLLMTRQVVLLEIISDKLKGFNETEAKFVLSVLSELLKLEFMITQEDAASEYTLNIRTYYLPEAPPIKRMRAVIFKQLQLLYKLELSEAFQSDLLKVILDIPRQISARERTTLAYKGENDLKSVLTFIKGNATQFNLDNKRKINDQLYWYVKWGLPDKFRSLLDEIKVLLAPRDLLEELSNVFAKAETSIMDRKDPRVYVRGRVRYFTEQAAPDKLSHIVIQYMQEAKEIPFYYWDFFDELIKNHQDYAKSLNEIAYQGTFSIYKKIGGSLLKALYFTHHQIAYYTSYVEKLQALNSLDADTVLLDVYTRLVPGVYEITEWDTDIIKKILRKDNPLNSGGLSSALQNLFVVKDPDVVSYCLGFLSKCNHHDAEMFFLWLSYNAAVDNLQKQEIVIKGSVRFNLVYQIEKSLSEVLAFTGVDSVFEYFLQRYEVAKKKFEEGEYMNYEFVPHGGHSYLFEDCGDEVQLQFYRAALNWYIHDNWKLRTLIAKDLLDYSKPAQSFPESLIDIYRELIETYQSDSQKLSRIIESLGIFHDKGNAFFELIIFIYPFIQKFEEQADVYKNLRSDCFYAIVEVGVKSGVAGEPYPEDIALRDALSGFIEVLPPYSSVTAFFKEVQQIITNDINNDVKRRSSEW